MENINEKIANLIDAIDDGNNVEAQEMFNDLLQDRIDAILGIAKQEVAASMFATEECADCEQQNEEVKVGDTVSPNYGPNKGKKTKVTRVHPNKSVDTEDGYHSPGAYDHHTNEEVEVTNEALKGNQHKIDANKNGKIDAQDFKMLRKKKVKEAYADPYAAKKAAEMKKKKEEEMAAAKKEYDASQESKGKINTKKFMKMEEVEQVEENKYSLPAGSTMNPNKKYKKSKSSLEKRFGHLKPGESASLKGDPKKVIKKEEVEIDEASYSAKKARAGKDIGKPGKMFSKIATKAARKYGKERGAKIAGAVLAKLRKKGK